VGVPVLRDCLRGINGTIFAYGQTGSGKTHSLLQQGQHAEEAGLLPRLVAGLFMHMAQDVSAVYEVEASALQVYNEQVDDLMHTEHKHGAGHGLSVQNGGDVPGLTWIRCQHPEQMLDAFTRARSNIVYAETKMNKASSRSHAVFQVRLTKRPRLPTPESGGKARRVQCTQARLSVVDLAGSERVKKSGVEGVHLREASAINKSLLALGNVVSALALKKQHVPLRDSKLTRLLEGSIGGNCKTVLLVCASPAAEHMQETISSLEFASRAMCVEVNAKVNTCVVEVTSKALLDDLNGASEESGTVRLHPELKEELQVLRKEAVDAAERARAAVERREQAVAEAEEAEKRERCWQLQVEQLEKNRQLTEGELDDLRCAMERAQQRAEEWRKASEDTSAEAASAKEAAESATARAETAEKRLADVEASLGEWQERATAAEEKLEAAVADADSRLESLREQAAAIRQQAADAHCTASAEAESLRNKAEEAAQRSRALETEIAVRAQDLELGAQALREARDSLERVRCEASEREAQLLQELADAAKAVGEARGNDVEAARRLHQSAHEIAVLQEQVTELQEQARADAEAAQGLLAKERSRHAEEVKRLEARAAREGVAMRRTCADQLKSLEEAHQQALETQRADFEARLLAGRQTVEALEKQCADFESCLQSSREGLEARMADLRARAKAEKTQLKKQLEDQRAELEKARDDAVREASESAAAKGRRMAGAFKAARLLAQGREAELRRANEELTQCLATRKSREEDEQLIGELQALMKERTCEIEGLRRALDNRDRNDRIFSAPQLRRSRSSSPCSACLPVSPTPPLPPLPSRKTPPACEANSALPRVRSSSSRRAGQSAGASRAASSDERRARSRERSQSQAHSAEACAVRTPGESVPVRFITAH